MAGRGMDHDEGPGLDAAGAGRRVQPLPPRLAELEPQRTDPWELRRREGASVVVWRQQVGDTRANQEVGTSSQARNEGHIRPGGRRYGDRARPVFQPRQRGKGQKTCIHSMLLNTIAHSGVFSSKS